MNKNTEQFQWTNELLKEWAEYYIIHEGDNLLEKFIQSKSKTEQPLWEILSFSYNTGKNNIAYKASNGYFFHGTVAISDTDGMLSSVWRIHSVKRLSDGEVFSVGDSLDWMGKIESIEIDNRFDGGIAFINNSQKSCISTAKKAPKEEQAIKPPLGLIPMQIWNEHRLQDINEALERYKDANKDVPETWLTEKESLIRLLYPLKQEQVFTGPESLSQHPMCKKGEEQVPIKVLGLLDGINTDNPPYGKYYTLIFNNSIPESKYQSIREAIEDVLNNKYKPWKMYQTGFTSEELLQAIRDAFHAGRSFDCWNVSSHQYAKFEDYINSIK